jgi:hypothetical protein
MELEREGLVRLKTLRRKRGWTLLPRLPVDDVGLVTIWNETGVYLTLWRSVFERRAPASIPRVEAVIGTRLGNGNRGSAMTYWTRSAMHTARPHSAKRNLRLPSHKSMPMSRSGATCLTQRGSHSVLRVKLG